MLSAGDEIGAICAREMSRAKETGDADAMGNLIERLARALGFTIAVAANGNPKIIETLIQGVEGYAFEEATAKANVAARLAMFLGDKA